MPRGARRCVAGARVRRGGRVRRAAIGLGLLGGLVAWAVEIAGQAPAPIVAHLRKAFTGTLNDKGMKRLINKINSEINHIEGGEWEKVLAEEQERLKKIYE